MAGTSDPPGSSPAASSRPNHLATGAAFDDAQQDDIGGTTVVPPRLHAVHDPFRDGW